jgi:hypothetical protein
MVGDDGSTDGIPALGGASESTSETRAELA